MQPKTRTNLILLAITLSLVFYLFSFTNFKESGLGKYFFEKWGSLQKIISKDSPNSNLTETERSDLTKASENTMKSQQFFCGSSYFPFLPGAKWEYKVSSEDGEDVITFGIPEPEGNLHFLDSSIKSQNNWTVRTIFICEQTKIKMTDLNFLETSVKSGSLAEACSPQTYAFSLPTDQVLGTSNSFEEKGCLNYKKNRENENLDIKEETTAKWKVLGNEDVEVPAGKFPTKKIEINLNKRQEFENGAKNIDSKITLWITKGVGIVKIITENKDESTDPVETKSLTQELTAFQIPTEKDSKVKN